MQFYLYQVFTSKFTELASAESDMTKGQDGPARATKISWLERIRTSTPRLRTTPDHSDYASTDKTWTFILETRIFFTMTWNQQNGSFTFLNYQLHGHSVTGSQNQFLRQVPYSIPKDRILRSLARLSSEAVVEIETSHRFELRSRCAVNCRASALLLKTKVSEGKCGNYLLTFSFQSWSRLSWHPTQYSRQLNWEQGYCEPAFQNIWNI